MIKNLRNKFKNKKGFTLVELIVVIVIILVLSAVLVPSVLKYIERANQANCKADAATVLVQLQADVADHYATNNTTAYDISSKVFNGVAYGELSQGVPAAKTFNAAVDAEGNVTSFAYGNARYYIGWTPENGWTGTTPGDGTPAKRTA